MRARIALGVSVFLLFASLLFDNVARAADYPFCGGDQSSAASAFPFCQNTGLRGVSVPTFSGSSSLLQCSTGSCTWTATSGLTITWASDLTGSTNSSQTVVSLSGAAPINVVNSVLSFGATPATNGTLRMPSGFTLQARNNANTANFALLSINASDQLVLGSAQAGFVTTAFNVATGGSFRFLANNQDVLDVSDGLLSLADPGVAYAISQPALASTSIASGSNGLTATVQAQGGQPATGAAHNGGNGGTLVLAGGPLGTSGSATAGQIGNVESDFGANGQHLFKSNTFLQAAIGYTSASSGFGALYLGNGNAGFTPNNSNYLLLTDGTNAFVQAPVGGGLLHLRGGNATDYWTMTTGTLTAADTSQAYTISQSDLTTNSATGNTMLVRAQNETGTTSTGATLRLSSGTGTTAAGSVALATGLVDRVSIAATGVVTVGNLSGTGTRNVVASSTGALSTATTPTWHTSTYCSSGCTGTTGSTYTPVSGLIVAGGCAGGGGGGGSAAGSTSAYNGGGGGGGAQWIERSISVTPSTAITVNVGSGGAGLASGVTGGAGNGGNNTLVVAGSTIAQWLGGSGGTGLDNAAANADIFSQDYIGLGGAPSLTQGGSTAGSGYCLVVATTPGEGGAGGAYGLCSTLTAIVSLAVNGVDAALGPKGLAGTGGAAGTKGTDNTVKGGHGGGGGGGGGHGNGVAGGNGGSGGGATGFNGGAGTSALAGTCGGGGGAGGPGAGTTASGSGAAGGNGGSGYLEISEYF